MSMEDQLREFLDENPHDAMVLVSLGSIYQRDGRPEEAIGLLTRAVAEDPEYLAAYPALGDCWDARGEQDEARRAYERALELARQIGDRTMEKEMQDKLDALGAEL